MAKPEPQREPEFLILHCSANLHAPTNKDLSSKLIPSPLFIPSATTTYQVLTLTWLCILRVGFCQHCLPHILIYSWNISRPYYSNINMSSPCLFPNNFLPLLLLCTFACNNSFLCSCWLGFYNFSAKYFPTGNYPECCHSVVIVYICLLTWPVNEEYPIQC